MSDTPNFAKLVPGFDFLQSLAKNAGSALPSIGQWVAPTLNPEELGKRIDELKTVQFWLEQNARMLGTTIQALEVQRMTLSTLKTMNVQMTDLRDAMKVAPVASKPADEPASAAQAKAKAEAPTEAAADAPPAVGTSGVVDPMQWWGALTKQFTQLAATAMKDGGAEAAQSLATTMMKQGVDVGETLKKAVKMPADAAAKAMSAAMPAPGATGPKAGAKAPAAKKASARKTTARAAKSDAR